MTDIIDTLFLLAKQVAATGADVHRRGCGRMLLPRTKSSAIDVVTEVDLESEQVMVTRLRHERPDDSIVSEEGKNHKGQSGISWILDPLDGTTNYLLRPCAHGERFMLCVLSLFPPGVSFSARIVRMTAWEPPPPVPDHCQAAYRHVSW